MKKNLFYCDTPFQLLVALDLAQNSSGESDLIIFHQFRGYESIKENIENLHIFSDVLEFFPEENITRIQDILDLIFTKKLLKKINFFDAFENEQYENFYASCLDTSLSLSLYTCVKYRFFRLFDDGEGSYRGNILLRHVNLKRRALLKVFHPNIQYFQVESLHLLEPKLADQNITKKVYQIHGLSNTNGLKAFGYIENGKYTRKKYIFLDGAIKKNVCKDTYGALNLILSEIDEELVTRKHPRSHSSNITVGEIDNVNNLWELEIISQITDDHFILSTYSSAMFQPAMLCSKKPYLVFLYKIFDNLFSAGELQQFDEYISRFQKELSYKNIFIPNSLEELKDFLIEVSRTRR